MTKDKSRFAPRAGVAYRLTDSTVIRAGYGLTNDPTNYGANTGNRQNYPDILATTLNSPNSFSYATTLRQGVPAAVQPIVSSLPVPPPPTPRLFPAPHQHHLRRQGQASHFALQHPVQTP